MKYDLLKENFGLYPYQVTFVLIRSNRDKDLIKIAKK